MKEFKRKFQLSVIERHILRIIIHKHTYTHKTQLNRKYKTQLNRKNIKKPLN